MRGRLITFEGIDGCGKTTMVARAEEFFRRRAVELVVTREPGGTPLGRAIRRLLLASPAERMEPLVELLLYAADRAQHVREVILPALNEGKIVLSDRYMDATVAYQGYGRGNDLSFVRHLMEIVTAGVRPDLTLLLDLDVETAQKRLRGRPPTKPEGSSNRLDRETSEFHERVRQGYLEIARSEPDRVVVIDARGSIAHTATEVIAVLVGRLKRWRQEDASCPSPR